METISKLLKLAVYCFAVVAFVALAAKLSACNSGPTLPSVDIEKKSSQHIKDFIKTYQGGKFTYIANGTFDKQPIPEIFGVWITSQKQETLETGRAMAIEFIQAYLTEVQSNKDTLKHFETRCKTQPHRFSGKIGLNNIGLRIAFWDENVDRPKAPFLSEIDFSENTFRYYQADPATQALKLVHEESYDAALTNLEKNSPLPSDR